VAYGGFWTRLLASLVDGLVIVPPVLALAWIAGNDVGLGLLTFVVSTVVFPAYNIVLHALYGKTLGKRVLGIRVRRVDGPRIGWSEAVLRSLPEAVYGLAGLTASLIAFSKVDPVFYSSVGFLERLAYIGELEPAWWSAFEVPYSLWWIITLVVLLLNQKKRALHDYIASTVVVHESG
jgi:uncharacterized RDD family membrane protein YckC